MDLTSEQRDRACGVLLGQACGDALGVPYEFATPPRADEVAVMKGGGLSDYAPGEWSDDTQMAACIALVSATGTDLTTDEALDAIAEHFLRWHREGATDIGIQTSHVLRDAVDQGDRPAARLTEAAAEYARRNPRSAGNGALMRTPVVGISALDDREQTALAARRIAELTHADPLAGDSAVLWSEAVRVAVMERRLDVRGGLELIPAERRDQWDAWISEAETREPGTFTPNGFTVAALQAAWSAITHTPVPDECPATKSYACQHLQHALYNTVRIGDDTDTVAAIAGGLLGAYWGQSAIPLSWVRRVHGWPQLRARDLVRLSILTAMRGLDDPHGWPSVERMQYGERHRPAVAHPLDDGVWLGTEHTTDHDATAVVSLFRRGRLDVPVDGVAPENHVEVRLIDSDDPRANPHLHFVLSDTAALITELRKEGHRVLVHCVAAQQRTPSVAAAYAVHLGASPNEAREMVAKALPNSRRSGFLWKHATCSWNGDVERRSHPSRLKEWVDYDRPTLEAEHCWFSSDRVPDRPRTTEFRRAARWHQRQWAVQAGLPMGWHQRDGKHYLNGSKIEPLDEYKKSNFLSPAIWRAVAHRLANPELHQTLRQDRLHFDLLSSMPMCFNLFGELSEDQGRARRAVKELWGQPPDQEVEVRFEHSPGRLEPRFTNDRTAFDAAIYVGDPSESRTVFGIETKYHESALPEAPPNERERMPRYQEIVDASGTFKPGWQDVVLGTELQQLWRDHLLLLSMIQSGIASPESRYVLVHPGGNPSFARAAERYRGVLSDDRTFQVLSLEQLIDHGDLLHTRQTARKFRRRYFW